MRNRPSGLGRGSTAGRTHAGFSGGRVIRTLWHLGTREENQISVTCLVNSKQCLRAAAKANITGNMGDAAKLQAVKLIEHGGGKKVLPPEDCDWGRFGGGAWRRVGAWVDGEFVEW